MKVLFVTQTAAVTGGVERWLASLSTGLAAKGIDVTLALVDGPAFHDAQTYLAAFPELRSLRQVIVRSESGTARGRLRGLENMLRETRPDLVIPVLVHETLQAVQRRRDAGDAVKLVYPLHENEVWAFNAVAGAAATIDAVVSVNALMLQALQNWASWPRERSFHIRAGVDVPAIARALPAATDRIVIGYCGKLVDNQKRAGDLVPLCHALDARGCNYELRIAGEGHLQGALASQLAAQIETGRVVLLGSLDRHALNESFYPQLDALVVTSDWETGPLVAWEAMMHGVAIVTSAYRGLRSEALLVHGDNALVFPVAQPEVAARLIAGDDGSASSNSRVERLRSIGSRGRLTAMRELTQPLMIERWIAALEQIVAMPPRPTPADAPAPAARGEWLQDTLRRHLARPLAHSTPHDEWPRYPAGWVTSADRLAFSQRLDALEAALPSTSHSSHDEGATQHA